MAAMLREHLSFLYGEPTVREVETRLRALITRYAAKIAVISSPDDLFRLTERDALLITYGDQVREPDRPPLRTLGDFAEQHLADLVSGIHVLPFYPWTSDD